MTPPGKPEDSDDDEDLRPIELGIKSRKLLKEMKRIVREENEAAERRILEKVEARIKEELAPVREVAQVEREHSDFKKKKDEVEFEKEINR